MSRDMAHAAFAGTVQTAAERAGTLAELQDAIKTALRDLHTDQGETPAPAALPAAEGQSTNPLIRELVDALRLLAGGWPWPAVDLLRLATTRDEQPLRLTDREVAEILGWLGHTKRPCARCPRLLEFVATGPNPGWWRHTELAGVLGEDAVVCPGAVPVVTR